MEKFDALQKRALVEALNEVQVGALAVLALHAETLQAVGLDHLSVLVELDVLRVKTVALLRYEAGDR